MNEGLQPSRPSRIAAGEVLRKIYGDDFSGCVVTLDSIANIIDESAGSASEKDRTLIEVLTKVVEALQLLGDSSCSRPGWRPGTISEAFGRTTGRDSRPRPQDIGSGQVSEFRIRSLTGLKPKTNRCGVVRHIFCAARTSISRFDWSDWTN